MGKHCSYGTCNSDSRYPDRAGMEGVRFIPFPKPHLDLDKCKRWVNACSRQYFSTENITKDTYVCSKHFIGGSGPTAEHPDPMKATATPEQISKLGKRRKRPLQRTPQPTKKARKEAAESLLLLGDSVAVTTTPSTPETAPPPTQGSSDITDHDCKYHDKGVQVSDRVNIKDKIDKIVMRNQLRVLSKKTEGNTSWLCYEKLKDDPKKFRFYTGLQPQAFACLLKYFGHRVKRLRYWGRKTKFTSTQSPSKTRGRTRKLSPENQLLLTLVRLRRGYTIRDTAYLFGVSYGYVSTVVITWIQFLYREFHDLKDSMMPHRNFYKSRVNKSFRAFKNLRVIVDCTEFFAEMPRNFKKQGNMYSSYKHNHTFKVLVGMSPTGCISYISDAFEGAISDKELFLQCGIMDMLNPGDMVMADRGFTLQAELNSIGVTLNIPPFLYGRKKLSPKEELLTKKIARLRIHVERIIERIKKYRILKGIIPQSLTRMFSQLVFVVGCLVNFEKPIV